MGKLKFVAMLYIFALCGLFVGGIELVQKLRFSLGAEEALMRSTDPMLVRAAKYTPNDSIRANVMYQTSKGALLVSGKFLTGALVQKLARGESIPLKFLQDDPHRVLYSGDELPMGIGWLIVGFVALAVGVFAHRLLRKEAGGH